MMDRIADVWRRNWRRVAVLLIALIVLLLAARTIAGWWIGRQLREEVARLEKSYGSLNTHDMNGAHDGPYIPPLNRARVMRGAAELTFQGGTAYVHGWTPMMKCLGGGDCSAAATGYMREFVEQNRLAVYVATQGRTLPGAAWGVQYFRAETSREPRNVPQLTWLLAAACRVELEDGDLDGALELALTGLSEASSMRNEWSRLMQVWRILAVEHQAGCVREMLQREPSPRALSDLAAALADARWPDPARMALIGELRIANAWFLELERGRAVQFPWNSSYRAGPISWLLRPVVSYRRLGDLRALDRIIQFQALAPFQRDAAHVKVPVPSPQEQRKAFVEWWRPDRAPLRTALGATFVTDLLLDGIDLDWEFHSLLNAAETAVALRRYRIDHGSYPGALSQLVPQYLPWVPIDPFTGRPLEYARQAGGFELHAHYVRGRQALFDWTIAR